MTRILAANVSWSFQDFLEFLSNTLVGTKRRADIDFSRSSILSEAVEVDVLTSLDVMGFGG